MNIVSYTCGHEYTLPGVPDRFCPLCNGGEVRRVDAESPEYRERRAVIDAAADLCRSWMSPREFAEKLYDEGMLRKGEGVAP